MTTVAHASYRPKNKTIVRSLMNSLPGWIGHYAPALATPVAVSLFRITPARRSGPDRERALLSAARRRDLQFQGSTVATWQWGDTHRPLVLLVHGWGGRGGQFHPFVQPLLDAHYQVVTFDALGHGASDRRTSDLVVMTHSLQAVAAHFGPIHAIIAHSLGAATTALALREGLAVEKLVLISPAAQPERFPLHFLRAFGLEGDRLSRARLWFEAVVGRSLAEVSTLDNLAAVGPLET
ncbi:MAG: alpha/beta fold hydrolase, partial [Myxococcota bacterium]